MRMLMCVYKQSSAFRWLNSTLQISNRHGGTLNFHSMSQVPWTRIREFKEEQERKKRHKVESGQEASRSQRDVLQHETRSQGQETEENSFLGRFKGTYFKERLLFGGVVGSVTGAFFGGLDAVQGIKKGKAFGVVLNNFQAKVKFSAEHVGSAAAIFSMA
ncbi:hypothetical protein Naga_100010g47 [Nannochloropsis gaditana]|uniref:Uncharacterized protein n=1 Tax=Nannochloropsis gaditana TaxID=72520 RepID=W7TMB9_9STRA|nr:hypothetical protein Naga_100010g47 [Nannochloropsis gaditana]